MNTTYRNPVCDGADPFVLLSDGLYYHYATYDPDGYRVRVSADLVHWEDRGYCLHKDDVMGEYWFWAPEILALGGKFYMVYTSEEHLGLAVADSPAGPFVQVKKQWLSEKNAIDGHFHIAADGGVYLYYVRFDHGNVIYGVRLAENTDEFIRLAAEGNLQIDEAAEVRLIETEEEWETHMGRVAEGPFILRHGGKYYLTYSANDYQSPRYAIGYAVSENPLGPYRKYPGNPILQRKEPITGVGHHSFITSRDGSRLICVYHCHNSLTAIHPRMTCIDPAEFVPAEPGNAAAEDRLVIHGPTCDEQPGLAE